MELHCLMRLSCWMLCANPTKARQSVLGNLLVSLKTPQLQWFSLRVANSEPTWNIGFDRYTLDKSIERCFLRGCYVLPLCVWIQHDNLFSTRLPNYRYKIVKLLLQRNTFFQSTVLQQRRISKDFPIFMLWSFRYFTAVTLVSRVTRTQA